MTRLVWDKTGERRYETGVDRGVLYIPNAQGLYENGVAWNGLTGVTESPTGAEATAQYADNIKYLNLVSAEEFGGTIEAFTYPDEFEQCNGVVELAPGLTAGQQNRQNFGFAYRSLIGNDVVGTAFGYKLNLVYGALAAPSEKARATVNDSPEAMTLSWAITTTPVEVPGAKPSAHLVFDSTKTPAGVLEAVENILYGTAGTSPRLPLPVELVALVGGATTVFPTAPTFNDGVITIPSVTGVTYYIDGEIVTGAVAITEDTVVTARPNIGYVFPTVSDDDWLFLV